MACIWEMFVEKTSLALAFFVKKMGLKNWMLPRLARASLGKIGKNLILSAGKKQSSAFDGLEQNERFRRTIFRLIFFVRRNIKKPPLQEA